MQANRNTRLKRILEETKEADGEAEVRERMQMLSSQLIDSISNLHEVFSSHIFIATCRGFWDKMGQVKKLFLFDLLKVVLFPNPIHILLGCVEVSGGQKRKSSLVQWLLLCSGGKLPICWD